MLTIYKNGDIITMSKEKSEEEKVECILVKDGKIEKIGTVKEIEEIAKKYNEEIHYKDLEGKTILPGFIDSHSHITALAQTLGLVSLKEVNTMKELVEALKNYKKERNITKGEWIIGFGYDNNFLKEQRHPNKLDLDILNENPVLIAHVSGHMGVTNSLGLEKMKLSKETKNPEGGIIGKFENGELNGYLEETAFQQYGASVLKMDEEKIVKLIREAQKEYAKNGITTVQDGLIKKNEWNMLKTASDRESLFLDVVGYVEIMQNKDIINSNSEYVKKYNNHLKLGGYKLILDGSPQGKTAWMSKPYEGEKEYRGYPTHSDEEVEEEVKESLKTNLQLLTHCNGDSASEQLIKIYEKQDVNKVKESRPVMIHAQTVTKEQLERIKKLKMIPSFFVAHTYYWGDVHIENLGIERARKISPANSALKQEIPFTFHQDAPVIEPNMFETIWCAVKRKTKNGKILGEEERIPLIEAIKAVTINAAYQYFEENEKGSIKEGKLANFIIIDKNPFEVETDEIKNIQILETIKEGETLWKN